MKNIYPHIFFKNINVKRNNNFNKFLLKEKNNVGNTKYFPPVSKEWKNSLFFYNTQMVKYLPVFDNIVDKMIQSFFNSYFQVGKNKALSNKTKFHNNNKSFKQIYISKSELKHTYSKVIITIYIYNKQKISLLRQIRKFFFRYFFKKYLLIALILKKYNLNNSYKKKNLSKKSPLYRSLLFLEKYKFKFSLNKYKFEEKFIFVLAYILSKFYKKKIEFNIVDLKSVVFNSDIFTRILTLKLKNKSIKPIQTMKFILNKVLLPKINRVKEKSSPRKKVNMNLLENKYNNLYINSMTNNNIDQWLNNIYIFCTNNNIKQLYNIIFDSIHYKNMGGIRLEIKGRLTRRYRADRAQLKVRWKGGLKNIDSSYKKLPSIIKRGYNEYNLDYSIFTSKRHVGAFATKGWISGK